MFLALALAALNQDKRMLPTYDEVRALLDYDPETGVFLWRARAEDKRTGWNGRYAGTEAGSFDRKGYRRIKVHKKDYLAHRLAWLLAFRRWPKKHLDHMNGDPADNRIVNLRECNYWQNSQNVKVNKKSKSGVTGVTFCPLQQKWVAKIQVKGRRYSLGVYMDIEDAKQAYADAKRRLHTFQPTVRGM